MRYRSMFHSLSEPTRDDAEQSAGPPPEKFASGPYKSKLCFNGSYKRIGGIMASNVALGKSRGRVVSSNLALSTKTFFERTLVFPHKNPLKGCTTSSHCFSNNIFKQPHLQLPQHHTQQARPDHRHQWLLSSSRIFPI